MARTVTIVPPRINRETAMPIGIPVKRKVAAYARVSTDKDEQQVLTRLSAITTRNTSSPGATGSLSGFTVTRA